MMDKFALSDVNVFKFNNKNITLTELLQVHGDKEFYLVRVHATTRELTPSDVDIVFYQDINKEEVKSDFYLPEGSQYIEITLNILTKGEPNEEF